MPGSSVFQDWNPTNANQESDAAYTADAQRSGGAVSGPFPSPTANKLFRQTSVFAAALADSMAAKGYVLSDASRATLAGVLAALITSTDLVSSLVIAANGGHIKFGPSLNGLIVQWGVTTGLTAGTSVITYPIPFTSSPIIQLTPGLSSTSNTVTGYALTGNGNSTFSLFFSVASGTVVFFWFAIGN